MESVSAPFLTEVDPRAAIKGSVDPLGAEPIWSRFGRQVVGNLTGQTRAVRQFTTLLLGYYFARRAVEERGVPEEHLLGAFLRFEQLAAYSRCARLDEGGGTDDEIRGIRRVRRNLAEDRVTISAAPAHQILSDQKSYGIWGLYSVAAGVSGLLDLRARRLTAAARQLVEGTILPHIAEAGLKNPDAILPFVAAGADDGMKFLPRGRHRTIAEAFAAAHGARFTAAERDFYAERLLYGADAFPDGLQRRLWERIEEVNEEGAVSWDDPFGMAELREMAKRARRRGDDPLADALDRIRILEQFLAPAQSVFAFLLSQGGQTVEAAARQIRRAWLRGLRHIQVEDLPRIRPLLVRAAGEAHAVRLLRIGEALHGADYEALIRLLLDQNREVMAQPQRGGGPWVSEERGRLDVRFPDESLVLPEANALPDLWWNGYFLDSLKRIGWTLFHQARGRSR